MILTRDQQLLKKNPPDTLLIQSNHFREQLKQVVHTCGLDPLEKAFTRCVECNKVLEAIPKESVQDKVPPYVYSTQEKFSLCRRCERIYWPATHHHKIIEELKARGADSREN